MASSATILARIERRTTTDANGCWVWQGAKTTGYGAINTGSRNWLVHRWMYEHFRGPILAELTLDHLCRNRSCCNPDHLEAVARGENVLRGEGPSAHNARKTVCKRGHEFTPANTYTRPNGYRNCRSCWSVYRKPA